MKIHPISLGLPAKIGTELKVRVVSFDTDATTCTLYYEVFASDKSRMAEGNINLTEEEFKEWGYDNTYLNGLVLEKLGLSADETGIEEIEVAEEPEIKPRL